MLFVDAPGKVITPPAHTAAIGLKVGVVGLVTFTVAVAKHPVEAVYVMVVVPKLTAVTNPVLETVAIPALLEDHALLPAGTPEPVSCEVVLGQITVFPVTVGLALMVIACVAVHPLALV